MRALLSQRTGSRVYRNVRLPKGFAVRRLAILLFAAAPLIPGSADGQTTFSLHGGPNRTMLAEVHRDTLLVTPRNPVHGMDVGLGVTFQFSPPDDIYGFGVQLNATYAQRGAAHTALGQRSLIRLHYLLLNALYDMAFPFRWERLSVHFTAGPTVGRLVGCQREFGGVDGESDYARPCPDGDFRNMEFALVLGARLELGLSDKLGISTGLQYHWGGRDIERHGDSGMLNRAISLRGGVLYTIR